MPWKKRTKKHHSRSHRIAVKQLRLLKITFLAAWLIIVTLSGGVIWQANAQSGGGNQTNYPVLDQLDQAQNLTQYIDILHSSGSNASVDTSGAAVNSYASYVSGAGQQLPMTVYPSGQANSPAIIYFSSGGNSNAQAIATGSADQYGNGPPVGGGANARGYTVIDASITGGAGAVNSGYEDALRAILHVQQNAQLYNIDPHKISMWGDGTGGTVALRAAASGRSGAAAAVAQSAPSNAYTSLFQSNSTLQSGMSYLGCMGSSGNSLSTVTQALESITNQMDTSNPNGSPSSPINLSAQQYSQCAANMNADSPALYTSPDTPPTFLTGYGADPNVDPQQIYDMRNKLQGLGVTTGTLVIQGDPADPTLQSFLDTPGGVNANLASARFWPAASASIAPVGATRVTFPDYHGQIGGAIPGKLTAPGDIPCDQCPNSPSKTTAYLNSPSKDLAISGSSLKDFGSIPFPVESLLHIGDPLKYFAQAPGLEFLNQLQSILRRGNTATSDAAMLEAIAHCHKCWDPVNTSPYDSRFVCGSLNSVYNATHNTYDTTVDCAQCPDGLDNHGIAADSGTSNQAVRCVAPGVPNCAAGADKLTCLAPQDK